MKNSTLYADALLKAVCLQAMDSIYRAEYFHTWFAVRLEQQGFTEADSHHIAGSVLFRWFEVLGFEAVNDMTGISLTTEMLPPSTNSEWVIRESGIRTLSPLEENKVIVAWNDLREQLLDEVFKPLENGYPVDDCIELSSTMFLVVDNDIELNSHLPYRMFTSRETARLYEEMGDA